MGDSSKIEWTDATWNCAVGCSVLTPGCTNCYAMRVAARHEAQCKGLDRVSPYAGLTAPSKAGPVWTGEIKLNEKALPLPLRWKAPRRIFVNSMSDLFHEGLSDAAIDRVFKVMALCPQHIFQVLTKRAARMHVYLDHAGDRIAEQTHRERDDTVPRPAFCWPLPNVWIGVSVEDRVRKSRIDDLRTAPASVRFLSIEPLLEDLGDINLDGIDWVICGGESGPGARPFQLSWARNIIDQCGKAGVACFVKQLGANAWDVSSEELARVKTRDRKGGDWSEWPADLRVREFPQRGV